MNLIFDFDGTICDSFDVAVDIIKVNFPKYYTGEITPEDARDIGLKQLIIKTKFPKNKLPKLMIIARREMAKKIPKLKAFPHIPTVLKKLSQENSLGILTSNSKENVSLFLSKNKLSDHFDFVYDEFAFFGKHKKLGKIMKENDYRKSETVYIGDETRDVEAAKKAGIKSIAVTWGYESEKVLAKAKPDYIVNKPSELLKIVSA